jgi:hypothetical protein
MRFGASRFGASALRRFGASALRIVALRVAARRDGW